MWDLKNVYPFGTRFQTHRMRLTLENLTQNPRKTIILIGLKPSDKVKGEVTSDWIVVDDYGVKKCLRFKAYYILASTVILFNHQSYFTHYQARIFKSIKDGCTFKRVSGNTLFLSYTEGSILLIAIATVSLHNISWEMCNTYHTTTQVSPGQLVFGRDMIFNIPYIPDWDGIEERK